MYIAYNGLQAYITCTEYGPVARGRTYNTTIAYEPAYLSTSISARAPQTCDFTKVIYTELANFPYSDGSSLILSLPSALSSMDPAWGTCVPASYGAFDPPSTLRQATALTKVPLGPISPIPPTPGRHASLPYAPATTTPATPGSPSMAPPNLSSGRGKKPDPPGSDILPAPGNGGIGGIDGDITKNVQDPGRGDPPGNYDHITKVPTPLRTPDPLVASGQPIVQVSNEGALVRSAPDTSSGLAQISEAIPSTGPADVVLDGSTYAVPLVTALGKPFMVGQSLTRASDGGIVLASYSVAPGSQATIAGHTIYAGLSDAMVDGSTYALPTTVADHLPPDPITLADGIAVSPYGSPDRIRIGTEIISSDGPAITVSGELVSLGPSGLEVGTSVLPLTAATANPDTVHHLGTGLMVGGSNGSNAIAFTGGSSRLKDEWSIAIFALLAVIIVTITS